MDIVPGCFDLNFCCWSSDSEEATDSDEEVYKGNIVLVSNDNQRFTVPVEYAAISKFLRTKTIGNGNYRLERNVPVDVKARELYHIASYMMEHRGLEPLNIDQPVTSFNMKDMVHHAWDAVFIDTIAAKGMTHVYELILAAHLLDIESLVSLGCAKVATHVKDKTISEITKNGKVEFIDRPSKPP